MRNHFNIQTGPLDERIDEEFKIQSKKLLSQGDFSDRFSQFSLIFDRPAKLNTTSAAKSDGALSIENPFTEQAEALIEDHLHGNEKHEKLYGVINDSIVSLSTIREFDGKKDWLSKQVAPSSSSSEEGSHHVVDSLSGEMKCCKDIDQKADVPSFIKKKHTLKLLASQLQSSILQVEMEQTSQ